VAWRRRVTDGMLVIACGVIHTIVGLVLGWRDVVAFARDGMFNSVYHVRWADLTGGLDGFVDGFAHLGGSGPRTFWFLWTGLAWVLVGAVCHWIEHSLQHRLPRFIGVALLVYSVVGFVLVPVSGFVFVVATSLVLLRHASASEDYR
jgi:hypothetical protein